MERERSLNIHKNIVSFSKPVSGNIKVIISHDSTVVENSEMSTGCIIIVFNVCPCQFVLSLQIPCLKFKFHISLLAWTCIVKIQKKSIQ